MIGHQSITAPTPPAIRPCPLQPAFISDFLTPQPAHTSLGAGGGVSPLDVSPLDDDRRG